MKLQTYVLVPEREFVTNNRDPLSASLDSILNSTQSTWQKSQAITNTVNGYLNRNPQQTQLNIANETAVLPSGQTVDSSNVIPMTEINTVSTPQINSNAVVYTKPVVFQNESLNQQPHVLPLQEPQIVYVPAPTRTIIKDIPKQLRGLTKKKNIRQLRKAKAHMKMDVDDELSDEESMDYDEGNDSQITHVAQPSVDEYVTYPSISLPAPPVGVPITYNAKVPSIQHVSFPTQVQFPSDGSLTYPMQTQRTLPEAPLLKPIEQRKQKSVTVRVQRALTPPAVAPSLEHYTYPTTVEFPADENTALAAPPQRKAIKSSRKLKKNTALAIEDTGSQIKAIEATHNSLPAIAYIPPVHEPTTTTYKVLKRKKISTDAPVLLPVVPAKRPRTRSETKRRKLDDISKVQKGGWLSWI